MRAFVEGAGGGVVAETIRAEPRDHKPRAAAGPSGGGAGEGQPHEHDSASGLRGRLRPALRAVVVSGSPLTSEALVGRLASDERFGRVEGVAEGQAAVSATTASGADVAVVLEPVAGLRGAALVRALVDASGATAVVVVGELEPRAVHEAVAAGARAYLGASEPVEAIVDAIVRVARGEVALSASATASLVAAVRQAALADASLPSGRELEVLALLAKGATAREMAGVLIVSEATVKTYLHRLYAKLGVRDKAAAVAEAMRRGWLA